MPYAFQGGTFLQPGSFRNGPGDIFVNSAGYKHVRSPDGRPQTWTTGMVEVTPPRRVST